MNNPDRSTSGRETRRIAGVIFDMDGVLVESEPFIAEAAVRTFAEKGVAVRPEDFRPFSAWGRIGSWAGLPRHEAWSWTCLAIRSVPMKSISS